ncbi:MAG: malto-oligosyltrehalose trehalohydrolase [Burkholderiaceae bacterium]
MQPAAADRESAADLESAGELQPGAHLRDDGGTSFTLFAPPEARIELLLEPAAGNAAEQVIALVAKGRSAGQPLVVHQWRTSENLAGRRYRFRVAGGAPFPDPASRCNPDDAHGASVVVDPRAFRWRHPDWAGLPWHRYVLYELHVGTFTAAGTFAAAIERLDELATLGITAIEVMPVADFPGQRNWGYDGVLPYAPDGCYGTPDDFRRFVDEAHGRGIAVILDVVYNHFGPDGNYLHGFAPAFFNEAHQTPWGAAINFDAPGSKLVRAFFVENAWYWIDAFRLDGLRLDAVHAIRDDSPTHLVAEIAQTIGTRLDRQRTDRSSPARAVHLIAENELNQASLLVRQADGTPKAATAQWNDDIHHALHVLVTGETDGYYGDFADAPARRLADGLAHGFIYRGEVPVHSGGEPRGEPSEGLHPKAFINFLQNHDQVGNRAMGERIGALAAPAAVRTATACVLLAPAIPMLVMGEEFAASAPFLYFCDFEGELATAIRDGRRREFGRFERFADPAVRDRIPDPTAESTFVRSRLDWSERQRGEHAVTLEFIRRCLDARRSIVEPLIAGSTVPQAGFTMLSERAFIVRWQFGDDVLALAANFDGQAAVPLTGHYPGRIVLQAAGDGTVEHRARDLGADDGLVLPPNGVALFR